ncbi:MAG: hypothetical protein Q9171_000232 [Xanthocarpia ochracea]
MGEVDGLLFEHDIQRRLGTENLNSCTAIVVLCGAAAILAHIAPRPANADPSAALGDAHMISKLAALKAKVIEYESAFRQKPGPAGVIAYAVFEGTPALQSQLDIIKQQFTDWKIPFTYKSYAASNQYDSSKPARGIALVDPRSNLIRVYVEDNLVYQLAKS